MQDSNKLEKAEIRNTITDIISRKEPSERKSKSDLILKNLISSDFWNSSDIIFTYLALDNEVETGEIIKCAIITGKKVAVPRIVGKKLSFFLVSDHIRFDFPGNGSAEVKDICDMESIYEILNTGKYDSENDDMENTIFNSSYRYLDPYHERHFEFNQFNILEPKVHLPVIYYDNLRNYNVLLIVPGVAFTKDRYRLGRGGGYYDRTINGLRNQKIRSFLTVGLFFEDQMMESLPLDSWDEKLDFIVTESKIY